MIEFGDCRDTMRRWKEQGIKAQTCVTSPPYFGLRDYGHDGQIGLEQTPDQYIEAMVEVFRCVRDVLANDGTVWLNIGDSYASAWACNRRNVVGNGSLENGKRADRPNRLVGDLKEKDLIGIPWMLAFALRADGWYLRQDIIWHKPNPMPESVRDRCTKAHEYMFLLSKSEKYYFDTEANQEPAVADHLPGNNSHKGATAYEAEEGEHHRTKAGLVNYAKKKRESVARGGFGGKTAGLPGREAFRAVRDTRNRRSVWTVNTRPYKGAHFATFPPALIEPCILAGSRGSAARPQIPRMRTESSVQGPAGPEGQGSAGPEAPSRDGDIAWP